MFWQFGFHLPYSQSVSKSPVGVRTVKHLFSPWKSVCYSLGRLSQGISCWNEYSWWKVFNPQFFLQGSGFEFLSEVWLSRRQSALFKANLTVSNRHVAFGKLLLRWKRKKDVLSRYLFDLATSGLCFSSVKLGQTIGLVSAVAFTFLGLIFLVEV